MYETIQDRIEAFTQRRALFIHDGDPRRPHPRLNSGLHSNGFFNSRLITSDKALMHSIVSDLTGHFFKIGGNNLNVDGVVGPKEGATRLAELLSYQMTAYYGSPCFFASPKKETEQGRRLMIFDDEDRELFESKPRVVLCDDVFTTGGSLELTTAAIEEAGGIVLPYAFVIVNRSLFPTVQGTTIISFVHSSLQTWPRDLCPYCVSTGDDSQAIPSPEDHWELFTKTY